MAIDTYGPRVLPAVKSVADDIGNAASNFLDKAAHGFNAANSNCSCNSQPAQSSAEEDSKQNNNNSNQQNTQADKLKANAEKGAASEQKVLNDKGLAKNTQKVSGSEGKSVPDGLTEKESVEIKDAARVTDSKQARVQQEAAKDSGRTNTLVTGEKTNVTPKASSRYDQIERRKDLGPQK